MTVTVWAIMRDGREIARRDTEIKCVAELLLREMQQPGRWFEPVERFGVVWQRGVEIREIPT